MRVCGLTASMLESQGGRRKVLGRIRGESKPDNTILFLISVNVAEAHVTSAIPTSPSGKALGYPVLILFL